jgi:hypothetical protein
MDQPLQMNHPGKGSTLMSSYAYDLLRRGDQKAPALLAGGEQRMPELLVCGEQRGRNLLAGGEQRGSDLLAGGEQQGPELLSSVPRPRAEGAQEDSGGADDTRRRSESEQVAA